jgi:hypothetical protein
VVSDEADAANQHACEAIDERRFVDAIEPAERAARLEPAWSVPWFNLSVAYKHARRWRDCIAASAPAAELAPDDDLSGPYWNMGIAATALEDWPVARRAWTAAGVRIPPGDGPVQMDIGATPIRVGETPEVVWTDRIDPCRAVITSVPLPECDRRCGDLVLHDGEPRGQRMLGKQSISVFDELDVLKRSHLGTWEVRVVAVSPEARDALLAVFDNTSVVVEDWTASVRMLCNACSLGLPGHEHDDDPAWVRERRIGVAAPDERDLRPWRGRREIVAMTRVL